MDDDGAGEPAMSTTERARVTAEIHYGKAAVTSYRTHAAPLRGLTPIPESPFTGRDNTLMGAEIEIDERSDATMPAYTAGDNSMVVATDTMKNFIHAVGLDFEGATLEGWLAHIGRRFLERYEQMRHVHVAGREMPYAAVPTAAGTPSERVFSAVRGDHGTASVILRRDGGSIAVAELLSGRADLRLVKLSGSAFAAFARDEYTTLPERTDRALHVHMDVAWRYADPDVAIAPKVDRYVASEQVRDLVGAIFDEFVSNSIQHLVHEVGQRMLERWPHLTEVSFEAQNRTWDLPRVSEADERVRVYTDPPAPYGRIGLVLKRA
jgi:urate oxidase